MIRLQPVSQRTDTCFPNPTSCRTPPSTRRPNSWWPDPRVANLIHSTAPAALAVRALPASRRQFLKASAAAGAGLVIGFAFAGGNRIAAAATAATADGSFAPNAFIRVAPDNTVTVLIKHIEMGQGTFTGLATLVAEEMDADWSQIRAEHAPADASPYPTLACGNGRGSVRANGGT